ncbi:D-hexose-6-phosphate mutarotase [Ectothiorhodospiraceae bacterium 2226]|nr:D-hexose-6-phosphate mutarotase [Ectothiorhodospiraceae bacterium 2226]
MNEPNCEALNRAHALEGLRFEQTRGPLVEAVVETPVARARVALQGAQVLHYVPAGARPVIWSSRVAAYTQGKGVRGGVPVCWPWFGPHPEGLGQHGFVRTRVWHFAGAERVGDAVVLRFGIEDDADTRRVWDHAFRLTLEVRVGPALDLELVTENRGAQAVTVTQALHSYLAVGDLHAATVQGLDGVSYIDKLADGERRRTAGVLVFDGPMDRIYLGSRDELVLDDPAWGRCVRIARRGSGSTVVWTPWESGAAAFADMDPAEYRDMVCIEATNAADDAVTVPPGGEVRLGTTLTVAARP